MCGIVGYIGDRLAVPNALNCLKALEYRGYDSAGVAYADGTELKICKMVGKLENLTSHLKNKIIPSSCAIGHTRWATHGEPNKQNAHPHADYYKMLAVVHNGIIENYLELKNELEKKGYKFYSATDTEVFANLLSFYLIEQNPLLKGYYAVRNTMHNTLHSTYKIDEKCIIKALHSVVLKCKGSFAVAVLMRGYDDVIFFAKNKSPLIIGKGENENFIASDTPALIGCCKKFYSIKDGEIGYITKDRIAVFDENLKVLKLNFKTVNIRPEQVILGNYSHFMEKEIEQGADSVTETINRIEQMKILERISPKIFDNFDLHITACGTALHAGLIAKCVIEDKLKIPVDLDYASEFRYKKPLISSKSICLFISQSGETADTLSCVELSNSVGATTIAFTNVAGSRMESLVDYIIPTSAGPEIAVASTKAYMAQLAAIYQFIEYLAKIKGITIEFSSDSVKNAVLKNKYINYYKELEDVVQEIKDEESVYFIGRGIDYLLSLEGALKLKEVSYIHCEAMPAGELKHGSLALVRKDCFVIAILTQKELYDKTLNNIYELNSRGAKVILFSPFKELRNIVYKQILIPETEPVLSPFVAMKPLQCLAYATAIARGNDPDKPRNLAKSVTVE